MTGTMMADAKGSAETIASKAITALARVGVSSVLPSLWEVVTFEARLASWGHRDVAKRYLALLRDSLNSSALGADR